MERLDTKSIGGFLKDLTKIEFNYLQHVINIVEGINYLIDNFKLTPIEVCEKFKIAVINYDDFIKGNFEYNIGHISALEYWSKQLRIKQIEDEKK